MIDAIIGLVGLIAYLLACALMRLRLISMIGRGSPLVRGLGLILGGAVLLACLVLAVIGVARFGFSWVSVAVLALTGFIAFEAALGLLVGWSARDNNSN